MRSKLLCFFLLCSLTAPLLVNYGWLHYQRNLVREAVKRQMIAGLDENALVLLKFTAADSKSTLHWEHAREFEYQGQMYDVVRTETKGDTIYYRCWVDHQESELNQQLKQLVASTLEKDPTSQENQERLAHFYKSLYSFEPPVLAQVVSLIEVRQTIAPPIFFWRSPTITPGVPPPQVS